MLKIFYHTPETVTSQTAVYMSPRHEKPTLQATAECIFADSNFLSFVFPYCIFHQHLTANKYLLFFLKRS